VFLTLFDNGSRQGKSTQHEYSMKSQLSVRKKY